MDSIIKLDNPIKLDNIIIDRIDLTKINKELFYDFGTCYHAELNTVTNKYEKYLSYEDNNLYIVMEIEQLDIKQKIQLEEKDIIKLITDYILYDTFIFKNDHIKDRIKELENEIKNKHDWMLIFDTPGEIPIKYGILNETAIFNRFYKNNNGIILAELIGTINRDDNDLKITLCLENNQFITTKLNTLMDSFHISSTIGFHPIGCPIGYTCINSIPIFYKDNESPLEKDHEFKINSDINLPELTGSFELNINLFNEYLYEHNTEEKIYEIYKNNKLPAMKIDILKYMLG